MHEYLDAWHFVSGICRSSSLSHRLSSQNAGQNCIGIERLIVHSSQHDLLLALLADHVRKLRLGSVLHSADGYISPVDCGAMISTDRFDELERIVADAVEAGAQLEVGGSRWTHSYLEGGAYFSPTVIGNVNQGMEIAQKERECQLCR